MIQLIYISYATREMNEQNLLDLLKQSRMKNEKYNVTGLLLYASDNFMQVLEGEAAVVDDIYQSILNDDRNTQNTIIQRKNIENRSFPKWSMGFKTASDIPPDMMKGYSDFLVSKESATYPEIESSRVLNLLNSFKVCTNQ